MLCLLFAKSLIILIRPQLSKVRGEVGSGEVDNITIDYGVIELGVFVVVFCCWCQKESKLIQYSTSLTFGSHYFLFIIKLVSTNIVVSSQRMRGKTYKFIWVFELWKKVSCLYDDSVPYFLFLNAVVRRYRQTFRPMIKIYTRVQ